MTNNSENCIFCKIISGEVSAMKLWEDEKYFIFLDNSPINPGHTLVLPKKHTDYIFDLNDREYIELLLKAKEVGKILKKKLNPKRVGMLVEGFGVHHVHVHLIPLNEGGEMDFKRAKPASDKELNKIAKRIME
jgi:histidine triad (HIT) family protein